jgi:hypothetical protein
LIPEIDIWRVANLMLKRYGDEAGVEGRRRADELAEQSDHNGAAVWRRVTDAIGPHCQINVYRAEVALGDTRFTKVCAYVEEGLERKEARLVFGGLPPRKGPFSEGYFAIPTVFADTSNDCRLAREEIFGPVLIAIPWQDEADAIRMANDSHYGLAAYVWTHDIGCGLRTAHAIESGWVQVNQGLGQLPGHSYGC